MEAELESPKKQKSGRIKAIFQRKDSNLVKEESEIAGKENKSQSLISSLSFRREKTSKEVHFDGQRNPDEPLDSKIEPEKSFESFKNLQKNGSSQNNKRKLQAQIAIKGLQDGNIAVEMLEKNGFQVYIAINRGDAVFDVAIGMKSNLRRKLHDTETQTPKWLGKRAIHLKLVTEALNIVHKIEGIQFESAFLLHDPMALKFIKKHHSPDDIAEYFGTGIGMYFCFLKFYTDALFIIAISGSILFVSQIFHGYDSTLGPLFCIGVALWSTLFLELWKRRSAETAYRWGVHGAENEEEMQVLANCSEDANFVPFHKYLVTVPVTLMSIGFCINVMLSCINYSEEIGARFGEESALTLLPIIAYSVIPIMFSSAYLELASRLNDFEGHKTEKQKQNALTLKLFAFQFVNFFSALFYIGFYLMDMQRLSGTLFSLFFARQITGNAMESGYPLIKEWISEKFKKQEPHSPDESNVVPEVEETVPAEPEKSHKQELKTLVRTDDVLKLKDFVAQLEAPAFRASDEYLEMIIQFGFCTLFAVAFPLAPLFAYLNNIFEYKVDLHNLLKSRRPTPVVVSSIGSWLTCLDALGYVATLTNCCLLVYLGDALSAFTPSNLEDMLNRTEIRILLAFGLEHILLLIKYLVAEMVDDEPLWVMEAVALNKIRARNAMKRIRLLLHGVKNATLMVEDPQDLQKHHAIVSLKKIYKDSGSWHFNPFLFFPIVLLPYLFNHYNLDFSWMGLVASIIIGYMQHQKDDGIEGLNKGEIRDARIIKLIHQEIPSWFQDSDIERADWLSLMMQHIWPYVKVAIEDIVKSSVEPIMQSYAPAVISILRFKKIDLGPTAPRVVGMKMLDTNESTAVLDLESVWVADMCIIVEVGTPSFTINLTLSTLRFSGKIRAELSPLVPKIPCFGTLSLSLMEMPRIDYSFKVGPLDVMSLGSETIGVAKVVTDVSRIVLKSLMLYPNKLSVPIMDETVVQSFESPLPEGILQINLIGADNLVKADVMGKSDPYVVIQLGASIEKTKVIKSELNPRWNQYFDMIVYHKQSEVLKLSVYDEDIDDDDFLGEYELKLSVLCDHEEAQLHVPLRRVKTGSLIFKLTYVPLQKSSDEEGEELPPDIIFGEDNNELTDATVGAEIEERDVAETVAGAVEVESKGISLGTEEIIEATPKSKKKGKRIKSAITAVAAGLHLVSHVVPPDPHRIIDLKDRSMGILCISNLHVEGYKAAKVYCVLKEGHSVRETSVSKKGTEADWMTSINMLIRSGKTAQVEIALNEEKMIGDSKIGSCQLRVSELVHNDNAMDINQPLEGEKITATIRFRAIWIPAEQPEFGL